MSAWLGRPRILVALAALAVVLYLGWPGGPDPLPPLDPARDLIVFLGDSITSGHGLPLEVTFPHRLGTALGIRVLNAGISGDTTAGALGRLSADVLSHRPKLVLVELGANDAFRGVPATEAMANLRTIVRRIRDGGSGVLLLHVAIPARAIPTDRGGGYLDGFRAIAREESAGLVEDFLDGVVPGLTTDGLHPTAEGHARLAERLLPALRARLGR
jgi:lysophospholipase L1-like esterase